MPSVLLTILGLLLAAVAILLVLLWAVPVRAGGRWSCSGTAGLSAGVYGGWGALRVNVEFVRERTARITLFGRTVKELSLGEPEEEPAEKAPPQEQEAGEKGALPEPSAQQEETGIRPDEAVALAQQGISLWPQVSPHLLAMLRQVSFGHLTADCRFGLGDAAATGQAFGAFAAIRGVLSVCARIDLRAEPVFTDCLLEGEGEGELVIRHPAALLPPVIRLIMIKDLREMMKQ